MTLPTPVIFFFYFHVIIPNSQLPKCTKMGVTINCTGPHRTLLDHTGPHCTSAGPYRTRPHRVVGGFDVRVGLYPIKSR